MDNTVVHIWPREEEEDESTNVEVSTILRLRRLKNFRIVQCKGLSIVDIGLSQHCRDNNIVATTTLRAMTILSQQYDGDNGNNDDHI